MFLKVSPTLNVDRQRRRVEHLIHDAPDDTHRAYLRYLLGLFEHHVTAGRPVTFDELLPAYYEEFDLEEVPH